MNTKYVVSGRHHHMGGEVVTGPRTLRPKGVPGFVIVIRPDGRKVTIEASYLTQLES